MKQYESRTDTYQNLELCECGHYYMSHEVDFFPGNWIQRNIPLLWKDSEGGKECKRCMCPKFKKEISTLSQDGKLEDKT